MTLPALHRQRRKLGFESDHGLLGNAADQSLYDAASGGYWVRTAKSTGSYAPAVPLPLLSGQSIPPVYNWPVRVGQDRTGRAVILGVDDQAMRALSLPARVTNPLDTLARYTQKELLTELLCIPDPSQGGYAKVYPGRVIFDDQAVDYTGGTIEVLAASAPASGNHLYAGVFLTPAGALEVQTSTAQANTSALDVTDVQECLNAATAGSLLLRTFQVDGDDVELDGDITNSPDWRNLWTPVLPVVDAADVTYTPTTLTDWTGSADPGNQDDANDQLASRVTALEGQPSGTFNVINNSGGAASAGDVGRLQYDSTDAYEYVTTTTEADAGPWCVVVTGGANGASIEVATSGNHTLNYAGSAPAKGDYLVTSTTAGSVVGRSGSHYNLLAVATAAGSGGTVAALLLVNRTTLSRTDAENIIRLRNFSGTDFVSTINGSPSGVTLVYGSVTAGAESNIEPISASEVGKIVLHNTTQGESLLIDSVDTGTNTITFTSSVPGTWGNGDTITARSQTNTSQLGSFYWYDIDLSSADNTSVPVLVTDLIVEMMIADSGAVDQAGRVHPYETNATSKRFGNNTQNTGASLFSSTRVPLIDRTFCIAMVASGSGTANYWLRLQGVIVATP